ncbi:hypothetical protein GGX14DRAFT_365445, partial [Mycena pura]
FRQIPTFGRAIRRFYRNVSEMKKFAARDFEDVIQCIWPVLEGLFPDPVLERLVMDLCFSLAVWHGHGKLRLHTSSSISRFRTLTTDLCKLIRRFASETRSIKTLELDREAKSRGRRLQKHLLASNPTTTTPELPASVTARLPKSFNPDTYKIHAIPDYPDAIRLFGSMESFSTHIVCSGS